MFKKPYSKADWVATFLVVAMFSGAGWCRLRERRLLTRGIHVQGTLVNTNPHPGGRYHFYEVCRPFVSYTDTTGKSWTLDSKTDTIQIVRVGQTVPVIYDPDDPGRGEIEQKFWERPKFTASGNFFFIGLLLLVPLAILRYFESIPVRKHTLPNPADL